MVPNAVSIENTHQNIRRYIKETPLWFSPKLSDISGARVHLKLENQQVTGSFKIRGVASKFHQLSLNKVPVPEVAAASTGNHAVAVLHMAQKYGCHATVFVPEVITKSKLHRLQSSGAHIRIAGRQSGDTELIAAKWAAEKDIPFIHPYNDEAVIAGQGTLGVEIIRQSGSMERVFVPIGGGGLVSGIALYLKAVAPAVRIIGVQPQNASEMTESVRANRIVAPSTLSTLSDGTAGGLDPDTITFDICKKYVDEYILVSEPEIAHALYLIYAHTGMKVEPAAALAWAGLLKSGDKVRGKVCTAIVCGDKIDEELFREIVAQYDNS